MVAGVLIAASGILSAWLGAESGAAIYAPDRHGVFGHVGVGAGLLAVAVGLVIVWISVREYTERWEHGVAGVLTLLLGHIGAATGALYVGTSGLALCYVAGIWHLVLAAQIPK